MEGRRNTFLIPITMVFIFSAGLFAQTQVQQLFNRVLYFNDSGLIHQTPVQLLDDGPASTRGGFAQKNMFYYGTRFYLAQSFNQNAIDNNDIYLRTSTDGLNWTPRMIVNGDPGGTQQRKPVMAIGGDPQQPKICVVWQDQRDPEFQLWAAVSTDGGQTFSTSVKISDHSSSINIIADVAIDNNGDFYVTWNRRVGNNYYITWFSRTTDDGQTWLPEKQVHSGRVFSFPSQIVARENGELLIGICDDQNSKSNLVVYSSTDAGDNWQLETQATNFPFDEGFRYYSMLKDEADTVHFLFEKLEGGQIRSYRHMTTSDWGGSWSNDRAASDTTLAQLQNGHSVWNAPGLAITPSGTIYASWADKRTDPFGTNYETWLTRSTDGGQTWMPEIRLNEILPVDDQGFVSIAVKSDGVNDTLAAVWTETRSFAGSNPPNPFSLLTPPDNAQFTFTNPVSFGWQQSVDPDGDPVSYDLRIWDDVTQTVDTTVSGITTTNRGFNEPGYLKFGGQYRWTVTATDGQNSTAALDTFTFRIADPLFPTALLQPTNNLQIPDLHSDILFTWLTDSIRANGPIEYEFRLFNAASDTGISGINAEQLSFNGSSFLRGNDTYQWCVLASDGFTTISSDTFLLRTPAGILSGEYTIGDGGSFADFNTAVNVLNTFGVAGPTTFKVLPGVYQEKFRLVNIPGQGDGNPVVFESQSGTAADVLIQYQQTSGDTAMLVVDSVDNVVFRDLGFRVLDNPYARRQAVHIQYSNQVLIEGCVFEGPLNTSSTHSGVFSFGGSDIIIRGNSFSGNGNGILVRGASETELVSGVLIEENSFADCDRIAIYLMFLDAPDCRRNQIDHDAELPAIMLNRCMNNFTVAANSVSHKPQQLNQYKIAVRIWSCDGNAAGGQVVNNMIRMAAADSAESAVGLELFSSNRISVLHNTISVRGSSGHLPRYAFSTWGNVAEIRLRNNILAAGRGGYAYVLREGVDADYNVLHTIGPYIARVHSSAYRSLSDLQRLRGLELNSPSGPMRFVALDDLHSSGNTANAAGIPLAEVAFDIDGEPRDPSSPDIGADEYTPQSSGLSGSLTVGSGGDFSDPQEAGEALHLLGVNGPVTLELLPGNYPGLYLAEVDGASEANSITLRSQTGRSEDVQLGFTYSNDIRHLVYLNGSDYMRFNRLTFQGGLSSYWYGLVHLENDTDDIAFIDCRFEALPAGTAGGLLTAVGDTGVVADNLLLRGNEFTGGHVMLRGHSTTPMKNSRVDNNRFTADSLSYYQLDMTNQEAAIVQRNTLIGSGKSTWYTGLNFTARQSFKVENNRIRARGTEFARGIFLSAMTNESATGALINNFIIADGDSGQAGVYLQNLSTVDLFYNSIAVGGGRSQRGNYLSSAIVVNNSGLSLLNTIAANTAGGSAVYTGFPGDIIDSDYNDLFATGSVLVRVGDSTYADLFAVRAATGMEGNSLSVNPRFLSTTDLHLSSASTLDNQGTPVAGYARDIDRQTRSTITPDIGADEFTGRRVVVRRKGGLELPLPPDPPRRDKIIVSGISNLLQNGYVLADLHVLLDTLLHHNVTELDMYLSHNGIRDTLVYALPAGGSNFINTIFDDSSSQAIEQGSAPYTGRYRPSGSLSGFIGSDPEGEWELEIVNNGNDSSGVLQAWGLELEFEFLTALDDPADNILPTDFVLQQNYPNPFNPETTIRFALPQAVLPQITIYNALGQLVKRIDFAEKLPAGWHQVTWDAENFTGKPAASGVYFYRLEAKGRPLATKKMLLIR